MLKEKMQDAKQANRIIFKYEFFLPMQFEINLIILNINIKNDKNNNNNIFEKRILNEYLLFILVRRKVFF